MTGMVVYGGSQTSIEGQQLGWSDAIGIGIGTISMLGMAVFYVYVQKTEGIIAEDLVLYVEYATMCLTLPFLSLALEPNDWDAILHYDALDWGNLLFTSLGVSQQQCNGPKAAIHGRCSYKMITFAWFYSEGVSPSLHGHGEGTDGLLSQVYYGMNLLQQFIIRRVGASLFAMGTALRLVASIGGEQHYSLVSCHVTAQSQWLPQPCQGGELDNRQTTTETLRSCSIAMSNTL